MDHSLEAMKTETTTIDPKDFISPPFEPCPSCGQASYGVLTIGPKSYARRCRDCQHTDSYSLPPLHKKIIYLDQFVISEMMKALDPRAGRRQTCEAKDFWRRIYEKLHRLCQMQELVCPDSMAHMQESVVSKFPQALRQMYESVSNGITFPDPDTIQRLQMEEHAEWWMTATSDQFISRISRKGILPSANDWHDRFRVSIELPGDKEWIQGLRDLRDRVFNELSQRHLIWQAEQGKDFDFWFKRELNAYGITVFKVVDDFLDTRRLTPAGQPPMGYPPPMVILLASIREIFKKAGVSDERWMDKIREYFSSPSHAQIPFRRISAMLWAAVARKASTGQKRFPSSGMYLDVETISTLLPYCDAMFIDNECRALLNEEPLRSQIDYGTGIFSMNTKDAFLSYLDEIEGAIPNSHLELVIKVYGKIGTEFYPELFGGVPSEQQS